MSEYAAVYPKNNFQEMVIDKESNRFPPLMSRYKKTSLLKTGKGLKMKRFDILSILRLLRLALRIEQNRQTVFPRYLRKLS